MRTGCVALAEHLTGFEGRAEKAITSQAEVTRELAGGLDRVFKVMETLTSKSLPEWSSGMDAAMQESGSGTQTVVQAICTDVGVLAERVAVLEYRGEKFPGWVSEEISRQLLPHRRKQSLKKGLCRVICRTDGVRPEIP